MIKLSKFNTSEEEFDNIYKKEDPWEILGKLPELARINKINSNYLGQKLLLL